MVDQSLKMAEPNWLCSDKLSTHYFLVVISGSAHTHNHTYTHTHTITYRDSLDCNMTFCQLKGWQNKEVQRDSQILDQGQWCEHSLGIKGLLTDEGVHRENGKHNRGHWEQEVGLIDPTDNDTLSYYPHFSPKWVGPNESNLTTHSK